MKISKREWDDSQQHESDYWKFQAKTGNQEQHHRWGWYRNVCFPNWLPGRSFEGLRVMDVGSGPAGILHYIGAAGYKMAVDPLMGDYMQAGYAVKDNGVSVSSIAGEQLSKVGDDYDVVFCLNCLDHCKDPQAVLSEIEKCLKTTGTLVLCVDMRHPDDMDALHKIRIDESWIRQALASAGFLISSADIVPHQAPTRTLQFCAICTKG